MSDTDKTILELEAALWRIHDRHHIMSAGRDRVTAEEARQVLKNNAVQIAKAKKKIS